VVLDETGQVLKHATGLFALGGACERLRFSKNKILFRALFFPSRRMFAKISSFVNKFGVRAACFSVFKRATFAPLF
jgi:hypothetical protein